MTADELIQKIKKNRKKERMKNSFTYNQGVRTAWEAIWTRNMARSYGSVEKRFETENADIVSLPHKKGEPVLILGSGPSLNDVVPLLKDWKGDIICSTSQLLLLEYLCIEPTYCMLIDCDPNPTVLKFVADYHVPNPKTLFITHPQVPREYFELWRGGIRFFRMLDPGDELSKKYMPMAYGLLNEKTGWRLGSYILNSGNVANAMIPFAQSLEYSPIFTCGIDLGYPDEWYRGISAERKDGELVITEHVPLPTQEKRPIKYEKSINGVTVDELCYFYKYSMIILLGLGHVPVISCSRGSVGEFQYVNPKEVVEKQGKGFEHLLWSAQDSYRIGQAYLKDRQIYILKTDFWIETINIMTKKGLQRLWYKIRWNWYRTRPWRWRGGKGWIPMFIRVRNLKQKRLQKKAERLAEKAKKAAEKVKGIK